MIDLNCPVSTVFFKVTEKKSLLQIHLAVDKKMFNKIVLFYFVRFHPNLITEVNGFLLSYFLREFYSISPRKSREFAREFIRESLPMRDSLHLKSEKEVIFLNRCNSRTKRARTLGMRFLESLRSLVFRSLIVFKNRIRESAFTVVNVWCFNFEQDSTY